MSTTLYTPKVYFFFKETYKYVASNRIIDSEFHFNWFSRMLIIFILPDSSLIFILLFFFYSIFPTETGK